MKAWSSDIEQHIQYWSSRLGNLGWWPRYVYHFTDVNNAASIITQKGLYSRAECQRRDLMSTDNASYEVIQKTKPEHFEYVRLYFRPRTPTQYNNEGLRPIERRRLESHCPIPIFFCFSALEVLSLDETEFSNGNMGSRGVEHGSDHEFFKRIPFNLVFHNKWISPEEKAAIVFHRSAEVLVPHYLSLSPSLRFIACRSVAERQTLLNLLPIELRQEWSEHIRIGDQNLFFRGWTFVEEVVVVDDTIVFKFNPSTETPGPFNARFVYHENGSLFTREWSDQVDSLRQTLTIKVGPASFGVATLYLDDALAFRDTVIFDDLPF